MSLDFRKDIFANERNDDLNVVGKPILRQDILGHVTGTSPFFDDHKFDNLLHLKCVRSPHHHARILSINTTLAEQSPGVQRIILARDIPVNLNTLLSLIDFGRDDEPTLAEKKVSYLGEPVAAVIANSEQQALDAVAKIDVHYEVLPAVFDVEDALKHDAPKVNNAYPDNHFIFNEDHKFQKLRFGDTEAGFARAAHIVKGRYQLRPIEQAPIEPNGAIAAPETNDRFVCFTPTQGLFFSVGTCAKILNVDLNKLHFVGGTVGGAFGGKVDSVCEPLAILGAMLTRRPVRYVLNRAEEMQVSAPRSAELWEIRDALAEDGRILAREFKGWFDAGAYTRLTSYGVVKCTGHLPGPYTIPAVKSDIYCVFTDNTYERFIKDNKEIITSLIKADTIHINSNSYDMNQCITISLEELKLYIPIKEIIDIDVEKKRLEKNLNNLVNNLNKIESKLNNKSFIEKAPSEIIQSNFNKQKYFTKEIDSLRELIECLSD